MDTRKHSTDIPYVTLASEQARGLLTMLGAEWHPDTLYGLITERDTFLDHLRPAVCVVTGGVPTHVWTGRTWVGL